MNSWFWIRHSSDRRLRRSRSKNFFSALGVNAKRFALSARRSGYGNGTGELELSDRLVPGCYNLESLQSGL